MWMTRRLALLLVAGIFAGANVAVAADGPAAPTPGWAFSVSTTGAGVPAVEGPLLAQVRDDLIAYIRAQHLQKPLLVGHSLGAVVAFWAASVAPELVGEVVAVDGVPFASALMNPSAVAQDMEPFAEKMRAVYHALTAEQLAAQTRIALAGMISNPAQIELAVEWAKRSSPATKAFASNASRLDLILKAYEDQVALVPRHRVVAAAQALHFVMLDDPSFLLAAMDDFLNGRRLQ